MRIPLFQLDAFTTRRFAGNPAAVMPLMSFLPDAVLQAIAAENNLAETAFFVPEGSDFRLRWFTPTAEVALCGHATLASAAVVMERLETSRREVLFHTASGPLRVRRGNARYVMSFPARSSHPAAIPAGMIEALGAEPVDFVADAVNYTAVLAEARAVRQLRPDLAAIARLAEHGVIVTARCDGKDNEKYDFVSRFFAPAIGVPEDPVTGSAHCSLAPYWAAKLGKTEFLAYQASARGGEVICRLTPAGVELEGSCVFYLEGEADI